MNQTIIIVGGVAGGAATAARLRRLDEHANIILIERGEAVSFANCGLPYHIGGEIRDPQALLLQTPESLQRRFNLDVRVGHEVIAIDRAKRQVSVRTVATGATTTLTYDRLVLATGAAPIRPALPGIDSSRIFTLRSIPDALAIRQYISERQPRRALVVGGGFIGIEMAENLQRAGLVVTIVEMADQILPPLDPEMALEVQQHLRTQGVTLHLQQAVKAFSETSAGLTAHLSDTDIETDMVVLAMGVRPESQLAQNCGLAVNERGGIKVNAQQQTSDDAIYAVGDATEVNELISGEGTQIPLAGPAAKQGRLAADNLCGQTGNYAGTQGSAIVRAFELTVASTGINEKTATRLGLDTEKIYLNPAAHATYYPGAQIITIKAIFERTTGKLLGAQLIGRDGVDKRADVLATAIRFGATARSLGELELCYAPPYGSVKDPVNLIGFAMDNVLRGLVEQFHWHDVDQLPRDGSVTLLDVRTPIEFENGAIAGFINIPLDTLRQRLNELPRDKKVYITCQGGLRSYIASRILTQNGFSCASLSGGYRLYRTTHSSRLPSPPPPPLVKAIPSQPEATPICVDATGLQCPGPLMKLGEAIKNARTGDLIEIRASDPAFATDLAAYCQRTGNPLLDCTQEKGVTIAHLQKGGGDVAASNGNNKNFIVFSGDLDRALAAFVMANAAAAMGRQVSMFFTFWGLNVLRRPQSVAVKKDWLARMFGWMMPRGSQRLGLSRMNMGGIGAKLVRAIMRDKNIDSLEALIRQAQQNGVRFIACSMSMDVMGIKHEELIDGVTAGGAGAMLAFAEESDMSLFI